MTVGFGHDEIWKSVPGYEGLYEVSSLSRLRSLPRTAYRKNGTALLFRGAIKKISKQSAGYLVARLTKDGVSVNLLLHVMVASAFVDNPDAHSFVNHKDLNPQNCLPDNLEWVTHQQNIVHARDHGRLHGYTNCNRRLKLQPDQVEEIRKAGKGGEKSQSISDRYGISARMVRMIVSNKRWNSAFSSSEFKGKAN